MTTPATYIPQCADDFIGSTREFALLLERAVKRANAHGRTPLKFLINGRPGIGKSELVRYLQHLLGVDKWSVTKLSGTKVNMEALDRIEYSLRESNLFGDWRVIQIEETDKIPTVAQVRFLTLLDDLPHGVAVACTSNCKLSEFENRFQSRFQALEPTPPSADEISLLLRRWTNDETAISHIATFAAGNVRQALLDCEGLLQAA
jgi:replication-associated recombination protein RarA